MRARYSRFLNYGAPILAHLHQYFEFPERIYGGIFKDYLKTSLNKDLKEFMDRNFINFPGEFSERMVFSGLLEKFLNKGINVIKEEM